MSESEQSPTRTIRHYVAPLLSSEERKRRTAAMSRCRAEMAKGRWEKAISFCDKVGFSLEEARYRSWDFGKSLPEIPPELANRPIAAPLPPALTPTPVAAVTPIPPAESAPLPATVNGWPYEATATVWNLCRNPKLLIIELPDGRHAAMWRDYRRNWQLGSTVKVKIETATGDPIYEQVVG